MLGLLASWLASWLADCLLAWFAHRLPLTFQFVIPNARFSFPLFLFLFCLFLSIQQTQRILLSSTHFGGKHARLSLLAMLAQNAGCPPLHRFCQELQC
jgi:hypothetical protein